MLRPRLPSTHGLACHTSLTPARTLGGPHRFEPNTPHLIAHTAGYTPGLRTRPPPHDRRWRQTHACTALTSRHPAVHRSLRPLSQAPTGPGANPHRAIPDPPEVVSPSTGGSSSPPAFCDPHTPNEEKDSAQTSRNKQKIRREMMAHYIIMPFCDSTPLAEAVTNDEANEKHRPTARPNRARTRDTQMCAT